MKRKILYLSLCIASAMPSWVSAQDKTNEVETIETIPEEEILTEKSKSTSDRELDAVNVYGDAVALDGVLSDQQAYDAVYDENYSSDFIGKQRIDTYRGTNPADVLQSFTGIYSGDARNSGAIDPNVRGLQGEGRIPVRIDGTEQAITANRGYAGANNRNYIDPMLIGGIRVVKDSGLDTGVKTGMGGGIQIRTLNVNDFIEDKGFGGEVRIEAGSNAVAPRIDKDYGGSNMVDIPNTAIINGTWDTGSLYSHALTEKGSDDQFNLFKGKNYAGRIALGYKADNWDIMGVVAKRKIGNYFSGKKGAGYYSHKKLGDGRDQDIIHLLANYYPPGTEVFNTSSENTSYLFKLGFQPTDEQKIQFNYRNTQSKYGEIMPSQVRTHFANGYGRQIPLSTMDVQAISLQYALNPADNDWVDFKANLWHTDSKSDTYNSGGGLTRVNDNGTRPTTTRTCNGFDLGGTCYDMTTWQPIPYVVTTSTAELNDDYLVNNAKVHTEHTRYGIDLSNTMKISDSVDVTLLGSLQKEDIQQSVEELKQDYAQYPRNGRRLEWGIGFNTHWQATDKLGFDVGGMYSSYWLKDDLQAAHDGEQSYGTQKDIISYTYYTKTQADIDWLLNTPFGQLPNPRDPNDTRTYQDVITLRCQGSTDTECRKKQEDDIANNWNGIEHKVVWEPDSRGNYSKANNPCYNGTIANVAGINKNIDNLVDPKTCPAVLSTNTGFYKYSETKPMKGHAFAPSLAVNYQFNDNARIYARYNESVRFPNAYEGLYGFGIIPSYYGLAPERSHKFELGYVHNLTKLLPNAEVADIKLAYYQNNIENYIDLTSLFARNFDKKKTRGLELQARYDNGKFFGDIGINHVLKSEVCDEDLGVMQEWFDDHKDGGLANGNAPAQSKRCFIDGPPSSHGITSSVPDWSVKLHLGGRFLDNKLEAGTRLTYYSGNDNKGYWEKMASIDYVDMNVPYGWDNTFLVDAYLRYKLNKNFELELSGQNLTDRFYVDPASRTPMVGPGRVVKLNFTGRF